MYLIVEDNPNCAADERVFAETGEKKSVSYVQLEKPNGNGVVWCNVVAVDEGGGFAPAAAARVNDSSDGTAWLIFGGAWGLRFREENSKEAWSLTNASQWGRAFLLMDGGGASIKF